MPAEEKSTSGVPIATDHWRTGCCRRDSVVRKAAIHEYQFLIACWGRPGGPSMDAGAGSDPPEDALMTPKVPA
jgi:hypothetical protein